MARHRGAQWGRTVAATGPEGQFPDLKGTGVAAVTRDPGCQPRQLGSLPLHPHGDSAAPFLQFVLRRKSKGRKILVQLTLEHHGCELHGSTSTQIFFTE